MYPPLLQVRKDSKDKKEADWMTFANLLRDGLNAQVSLLLPVTARRNSVSAREV